MTYRDPLIIAIANYRGGMAAFNAFHGTDDESDAFVFDSYGPPMEVLEAWTAPATTMRGAREAIRLALEEARTMITSDMVVPLLGAALYGPHQDQHLPAGVR